MQISSFNPIGRKHDFIGKLNREKILEGIPAYVEKDYFSVFDGFAFTEGSPKTGKAIFILTG